MTPLEAIISIGTIWGAFFLGYFFAKGQSKKHVEKLGNEILESTSEVKKFNWI
jgi:hypothetical protein